MAMSPDDRAWMLRHLARMGRNEIDACRILRLMDAESDANLAKKEAEAARCQRS